MNTYDKRLYDKSPSGGCGAFEWPPNLPFIKTYLSRPEVLKALNVRDHTRKEWQECNSIVGGSLGGDTSNPSYTLLPELMKTVPLTLFNGDQDIICNYFGLLDMVNGMTWNGKTGFDVKQFNFTNKTTLIFNRIG